MPPYDLDASSNHLRSWSAHRWCVRARTCEHKAVRDTKGSFLITLAAVEETRCVHERLVMLCIIIEPLDHGCKA